MLEAQQATAAMFTSRQPGTPPTWAQKEGVQIIWYKFQLFLQWIVVCFFCFFFFFFDFPVYFCLAFQLFPDQAIEPQSGVEKHVDFADGIFNQLQNGDENTRKSG